MTTNIDKIEADIFYENDSNELPPSDIVAYNELRSCADLVRMYKSGRLNISPDFQREYVWKNADRTRFIDSLVKQLPIPSMCFSLDYKTQQWQVIDGLQRITSIIRFLNPEVPDDRLSVLYDVDPLLSGQLVSNFSVPNTPLHEMYTRVENLTLPITVLRCDYSKENHSVYLFTIFHRLNTGGLKLTNQEIRNCIYAGVLNNLLKMLNEDADWRKLTRYKKGQTDRFAREEQILRFFAFYDSLNTYSGRLAKFLNAYMHKNRNLSQGEAEEKTVLFAKTVTLVLDRIFENKTPPKMPIAMLEALLVGVAKNIETLETANSNSLKNAFETLQASEHFSETKLAEGLSGKSRVIDRISAAIEIFKN